MRSTLTVAEARILGMIQRHYGMQYAQESISWLSSGDVTIWVTSRLGATMLMVNLTRLAEWRLDSTVTSDHELRVDWLQIRDTNQPRLSKETRRRTQSLSAFQLPSSLNQGSRILTARLTQRACD